MPPHGFRLGKRPKRTDPRTLQFRKYLTPALASPPATIRWDQKVTDYGMDGNDTYGDCVEAAKAHVVQTNTANAGSEVDMSASQVVADYLAETGGQDTGLVIIDSLNYWRQTGLDTGIASDPVDKLGAYGEVVASDQTALGYGIYYCGSAIIGVNLPDYILSQPLGQVWDVEPGDNPPNPNNGHCVPLFGYDPDRFYCVTWGTVTPVTPAFLSQYMDEAYVPLDADFIDVSTGNAPNGFDLAQLQADLSAIIQAPPAPAPPQPAPPPPTGCRAVLDAAIAKIEAGDVGAGVGGLFDYVECLVDERKVGYPTVMLHFLRRAERHRREPRVGAADCVSILDEAERTMGPKRVFGVAEALLHYADCVAAGGDPASPEYHAAFLERVRRSI